MKKQLIIIVIIALLITVGFCGCTDTNDGGENNRFVGTWKDYPGFYNSITFLSDGTGLWMGSPMLWEIKDGKLKIDMQTTKTNMTYNYTFSDNYQTLTLIYIMMAGVSLTLVKQ